VEERFGGGLGGSWGGELSGETDGSMLEGCGLLTGGLLPASLADA